MASQGETENKDLKFFKDIPWCAKQLSSPDVAIWVPPWKRKSAAPEATPFFKRTLSTPDTLPAVVAFHGKQARANSFLTELRALVALREGVTGLHGLLHGGAVSAIFDEVAGMLVAVNQERGVRALGGTYVTAYLNTSFLRPVPAAPGAVLVVARLAGLEGRRMLVEATMRDEYATVLAEAEAMFVRVGTERL
ncbi:hypothetical protein DL766_006058 [Monosporascus sp. MC13-8B]|uniref:Thioesterase domain-containing protein n=1 Tax=Monosporascus cannonballus TaxID=155416 RepID=A0ABY0GWY0_9PEZI|nr:hypothetical protein DL762_009606 [Monosporascus cannonballus]RYO84916.1 hypothetical protein DL763_007286 [Monosporascus cannonballus]RYP28162.1 hypothetical protein DL766_006058 [Monosporascus sp. MC13-8B]